MAMQLPAYIKPRTGPKMSETALSVVGMGASPYLSIEGGRFTLVDAAGNTKPSENLYLDVVIVDMNAHMSKDYRTDDWDPNTPTAPVCFSDNGVAPSIQAQQPQSVTCGACLHNVWGSKISKMGSKVKACRDTHKLAILVPGMPGNIFRLIVTPNSLTNWRAYNALFQGQDFDLCDVVTRLTFEQGVMGTLEFKPSPAPWLDDATVQERDKAVAAHAGDALVGRLDRPRQEALPVPAKQVSPGPANAAQSTYGATVLLQPAQPAQPTQPAGSSTFSPQPSTPAQPEQPTRRRRRTQAEMQAAQAPQPTQQTAPFRPAEPTNSGSPFGMAAGTAPNAELQGTLNSIFGSK